MKMNPLHKWLIVLGGILLLLNACASGPETNPALERARMEYEQARATAGVMENAEVEMYEAAKALERAESADSQKKMTRLANLAEKQIQYAVAVAEQKMAEKKIEGLEKEEKKVLLDTRQRQIEQARQDAEQKTLELERKRLEAEQARRQAEEAQQTAMTMKQEAEQARQQAESRTREAQQARLQAEARAREAEQARRQAEDLKRQLTELQAKQTDRGLVLTLGDVLFETGKADLLAGAMRSIDKLAVFLRENPDREVLVEGHTDSTGGEAYNLDLSRRRADAVRAALLARGIGYDRITIRGYGESYPVASNSTGAGRQQNRRVEVVILDAGVEGETMIRQ